MNGRHENDKLGLAGNWIEVPVSIPRRDKTAQEVANDMAHHITLQQQWNSWDAKNGQHKRSAWPYRRREEETKSNQEPTEA